jgi:hypothetical protein
MKTIEQLENELAQELGYRDFNDYASNIDGNFYCAERMVNFQRRIYQLIQDELKKETMKKAIIDAYDQGRSDEETRFPFADDGENYYNLKFLNDSSKAE